MSNAQGHHVQWFGALTDLPPKVFSRNSRASDMEMQSNDGAASSVSLQATATLSSWSATLRSYFPASAKPTSPFGINMGPSVETNSNFSVQAGQCCFLCLEGAKSGQYAIKVPCFRPTEPRRLMYYRVSKEILETGSTRWVKVPGGEVYNNVKSTELAGESDAAIYERLMETCFQYQGKWKRWLPFYGIVDVREVNFQAVGVVGRDSRLPIHMVPIKTEQVLEEADRVVAQRPDSMTIELGEFCTPWGHSIDCQDMMHYQSKPCIEEQIEAARQRQRKLAMLHLLRDCARDPSSANGMRTLEGVAQNSCIFKLDGPDGITVPETNQPYDRTDELRGLHFTLGWQLDRMARELPVRIALVWLGFAVTWLCVIAWGGPTGDWSTAMGFGQVIVASVTLVTFYANE